MLIRILLIISYIFFCIRVRVKPWDYFRLNALYFNQSKGLFSKLDIDKFIPQRWRLPQWVDKTSREPSSFPVFVKPEWGQNSQGVGRADNLEQLQSLRQNRATTDVQYLVQEAALGTIEFEIFSILDHQNLTDSAILSVTQVNNTSGESYPINGIYNRHTQYSDITPQLTQEQLDSLSQYLAQIEPFKISRVGVRANSVEALINGDFEVIEINLFVPMPLVLLSKNTKRLDKIRFIFSAMLALAKVTKVIPPEQPSKAVLFQKIGLMRQAKNSVTNEVGNESH